MKTCLRWAGGVALGFVLSTARAADAAAIPVPAGLQVAVKTIDVTIDPASASPGQTVTWRLTLDLQDGWHTYPAEQPGADELVKAFVTTFKWPGAAETAFVGKLKDPDPKLHEEDGLKLLILEGKVVWERPLKVAASAPPGDKTVRVKLAGQVCTNKCVPMNIDVAAQLTVVAQAPTGSPPADPTAASLVPAVRPTAGQRLIPAPSDPLADFGRAAEVPSAATSAQAPPASTDNWAALRSVATRLLPGRTVLKPSVFGFILMGIFWGAVSLVTPCVFPMIPITVSFFLKQSEQQHHRPVTLAIVYCLTIVIVLTIAALALLSFFRSLSTTATMNFGLGVLFVLFALSLFGMYDLELPSGLARFTSAREGRGGLLGTMFMALTFTIVSFACVAPFLGGFGGTTAGASIGFLDRLLGGLAFSATFASPFFILALFPSLLKQLPRSGSWLNSVKVVMGFLELAAALKFFRTSELIRGGGHTSFFTYDLVLGTCVALTILCGLYLLGIFRLPYDTPAEHLGVARLMCSLVFLSLGVTLLPGIFHSGPQVAPQRPAGTIPAWVDSFLLPEARDGDGDLRWTGNLAGALDQAQAERRTAGKPQLVFVDFTGVSCTNCKLNERNVFSKQGIRDLFRSYHLVQLFTDKVPTEFLAPGSADRDRQSQDEAAANLWFQRTAFGTEQLPLYVILEPLADGHIRVAGVYSEGKINNEEEFADFLKRPLDPNGHSPQVAIR